VEIYFQLPVIILIAGEVVNTENQIPGQSVQRKAKPPSNSSHSQIQKVHILSTSYSYGWVHSIINTGWNKSPGSSHSNLKPITIYSFRLDVVCGDLDMRLGANMIRARALQPLKV